jgi:excisionase family DNA binding protein
MNGELPAAATLRPKTLDHLHNGGRAMSINDSMGTRRLEGPLLRPAQAAALLAVRTSWVYDAARDGRLPCIRVGRHVRFTRAMLEEWLASR